MCRSRGMDDVPASCCLSSQVAEVSVMALAVSFGQHVR
jgi:hypothetical protein